MPYIAATLRHSLDTNTPSDAVLKSLAGAIQNNLHYFQSINYHDSLDYNLKPRSAQTPEFITMPVFNVSILLYLLLVLTYTGNIERKRR